MTTFSQLLLLSHVTTGFVALILFWVPVVSRKGGKNHRKVGLAYVWFMALVAFSALLLSVENLVQGQIDIALFLGFLSLLTGRPLILGIESLKTKKGTTTRYHYIHTLSSLTLVIAGMGLIAYAVLVNSEMQILMLIFGILGISAIKDMIDLARFGSKQGYAMWLSDHISNMITAGIAAHTAFLVFGASSFLSSTLNGGLAVATWVAPTVIGTLGILVAKRKYYPRKAS